MTEYNHIPEKFVFTKMQTDAGEDIKRIRNRKELERISGHISGGASVSPRGRRSKRYAAWSRFLKCYSASCILGPVFSRSNQKMCIFGSHTDQGRTNFPYRLMSSSSLVEQETEHPRRATMRWSVPAHRRSSRMLAERLTLRNSRTLATMADLWATHRLRQLLKLLLKPLPRIPDHTKSPRARHSRRRSL